MKKLLLPAFLIIVFTIIVVWFTFLISQSNLQVLNPKGFIASGQRDLIVISYVILFAVFFPVIGIALYVSWKYRSGNKKPIHNPEGVGSKFTIFIYLLFLAELMLVFFYIVFTSSHDLDPRKPIASDKAPITVQVIALNWKWLFIYPEENIATVNFLQIPKDTPVKFQLTADGPMNSFWIPQLGGQIYSMAGMETKIHLMADEVGDYKGEAAEVNGKGFSGMRFVTRVSSEEDFKNWVEEVKNEQRPLTKQFYEKLAVPSENNPVQYFSEVDSDLYNKIIMKYMNPIENQEETKNGH